jgi:hypothetical protein
VPRYRKKPIVVDARVYAPGMEDGYVFEGVFYSKEDMRDKHAVRLPAATPAIKTLEGPMMISPGDYIVTGIRGERYPCKPDIFLETYEEVGAYTEPTSLQDAWESAMVFVMDVLERGGFVNEVFVVHGTRGSFVKVLHKEDGSWCIKRFYYQVDAND